MFLLCCIRDQEFEIITVIRFVVFLQRPHMSEMNEPFNYHTYLEHTRTDTILFYSRPRSIITKDRK